MTLAVDCYDLTRAYPRDEMFGLTSQIRRAASSVPANLAEGYGRETTTAFIHFLRISQGSLKELETHLILSERVGLASTQASQHLLERCETIGKMLRGLIRSLQDKRNGVAT